MRGKLDLEVEEVGDLDLGTQALPLPALQVMDPSSIAPEDPDIV